MAKINTSKKFLKKIKDRIIVIHYSSSRIDERPIKISSISIYDSAEEVIKTFSRKDKSTENEIRMLNDFFEFLTKKYREDFYFLGWNNKSSQYGLQVLQDRYRELTNKKLILEISYDRVYDLDRLIKDSYPKFLGGLHLLAVSNQLNLEYFELGVKELDSFEKGQFKKLDFSTSTKVKIIYKLFEIYLNDKLVINIKADRNEIDETIKDFRNFSVSTKDMAFLEIVLINRREIKSLVNEFKDCYYRKLPRSTIILAWALFMNFLYNFIDSKGLNKFLKYFNQKHSSKNLRAKNYMELCNASDSDIIEICFDLKYFSDKNIRKQFTNCLDKRNQAAHLNKLEFNSIDIEGYLNDIVRLVKGIRIK